MTEWLRSGGRIKLSMPLRRFNRLSAADAVELLRQCLGVTRWVDIVAAGRPYRRLDDLLEAAREAAFPFTGAELEAALATIPPTPIVPAARQDASPNQIRLRQQLLDGLTQYQRKFGRPFLIHRYGRDDAQILVLLWERLGHDIDTEDNVLAQQAREHALATLVRLVSD